MLVLDMHCDSLLTVKENEGLIKPYNFSDKHPHLQFAAAFVPRDERAPEERRAELMHYFNVYLYETARLGIPAVKCAEDIYKFEENGTRAAIFSVEGGGGLFADSPELEILRAGGLRVIGMAWDTNELAACAWDKDDMGLSFLGKDFVKKCDSLGIISDVSHLSDRSFYELAEISSYPIIATHSNFRELCDSPRNLTKDMAREIVRRGGVIGLNLYPSFLKNGGEADTDDIIRHVDFALENFGEDSLGFGFDIDGTDGRYPKGISVKSSIHDQVIELLLSKYSAATVEKIAGLNVQNFLKSNLV